MAVVSKRLGKGVLSSTSQTLYTAPSNGYTIIKTISLSNTTGATISLTMSFAGTNFASSYVIKANDTIHIPDVDQILHAGESIVASGMNLYYYISGKEVT